MNESEVERLIEQEFAGAGPGPVFRARLLDESTAALIRGRQARTRWRVGGLAAAAVMIAGVSFLCGRSSVSHVLRPAQTTVQRVTEQDSVVGVPRELITWLEAARFFERLGMQERVSLAYERAGQLVPYRTRTASCVTGVALAARRSPGLEGGRGRNNGSDASQQASRHACRDCESESVFEGVNRIMAQSVGG